MAARNNALIMAKTAAGTAQRLSTAAREAYIASHIRRAKERAAKSAAMAQLAAIGGQQIMARGRAVPRRALEQVPAQLRLAQRARALGVGRTEERHRAVQLGVAQRAQREATGYYCGYTFKPQVAGKQELRASAECLNYMSVGMQDKTCGQQWHLISQRVLQDCQHRCMLRTASTRSLRSACSSARAGRSPPFFPPFHPPPLLSPALTSFIRIRGIIEVFSFSRFGFVRANHF